MKINILIIFTVLFFIFINCQEMKKDEIEKGTINFSKQYHTIEINTGAFGTALCNNRFVILKLNGEFLCLNTSSFGIDSINTAKLNKKKCSSFYQMYDSLIVVENGTDYYVNSAFEFVPYDRYKNSFYKSDTTFEYDINNRYIDPLYSDKDFVIAQFCKGEFGGTVYFFDLQNNKEYYYPTTCASVVNKVGNKYIVTSSLSHMDASSEVIEVTNPRTFPELDFDTLKNVGNFWYDFLWDGQSLERYRNLKNEMLGKNRVLLDTSGILIFTSFEYQNQVFHLYSSITRYFDANQESCYTHIGKVIDNQIHAIDSLCSDQFFSYETQNRVYLDWSLYSFNDRDSFGGFVAIREDTISIVKFDIK